MPVGAAAGDFDFGDRLAGYILLQVEQNGEAWYVSPDNLTRVFLGRPGDAFELMRAEGVGIRNGDLKRIPVGVIPGGADADGDGLPDGLEDALDMDPHNKDMDNDGNLDGFELENGYDPAGPGVLDLNINFSGKHKGRIFLAVEQNGEAWYVNPADGKRYFLGRPADAFNVMRRLGLGVSDEDLERIVAVTPGFLVNRMEDLLHQAINQERTGRGLAALRWNDELAAVAREHSHNLAEENKLFTGFAVSCDYPIIHHEGVDFGPYNGDRLERRNIKYYSKAGENIVLQSALVYRITYREGDPIVAKLDACPQDRTHFDKAFKSGLDALETAEEKIEFIGGEINKREAKFADSEELEVSGVRWRDKGEMAEEMVAGWMASPGHRDNILEPEYDETGIGAEYVNGYYIATQIFIKRAGCGFEGGPCCEEEGYLPYCYVPLACKNDVCG